MTGGSTLTEQAHERIIGMILDGRLKAGDALQEAPLGEALGMSRTPVREAIKRIESEGLAIPSGRFTRVREPLPSDIEEIFFLRLELEPLGAAAAVHLSAERLDAIEREVRALMASGPGSDGVQVRVDDDFHRLMAEAFGNRSIARQIASLRRRTCVFDHSQVPERFLRGCEEHLQIIAALRGKNSEKAAELMRRHLIHARDAILERLDKLQAQKSTS